MTAAARKTGMRVKYVERGSKVEKYVREIVRHSICTRIIRRSKILVADLAVLRKNW